MDYGMLFQMINRMLPLMHSMYGGGAHGMQGMTGSPIAAPRPTDGGAGTRGFGGGMTAPAPGIGALSSLPGATDQGAGWASLLPLLRGFMQQQGGAQNPLFGRVNANLAAGNPNPFGGFAGSTPATQGFVGATTGANRNPNQGGYGGLRQAEVTDPGQSHMAQVYGRTSGLGRL